METTTHTECCPREVTEALTNILRESILLIRVGGNADDANYCAMEANHIHNLPSILRSYSRARLERYLAWARSGYASEFQERFHRPPIMFMLEWQRLEAFLMNTGPE